MPSVKILGDGELTKKVTIENCEVSNSARVKIEKEDGGIITEYELIAGERRLRASKLAGVAQVPVIIRVGDDNMAKLELAIIENLQREDLNVVDRARAFFQLVNEFKFTHNEVAKKWEEVGNMFLTL